MGKNIYVLFIMVLFILSIGIALLIFTEKEDLERDSNSRRKEEDNLTIFEWYQFKELRQMQNSKKPINTHLIWEHSTYGIYFVDSADQTVLLKTIDEGVTVSIVDLSDNANSYKIQSGWLDGNDLWLVMCTNPGNEFEVCYIEFDDSDDCNPIGVSTTGDAGTVYAYDIFKIGANFYVIHVEEQAGTYLQAVSDVDTAPITEVDDWILGGIAGGFVMGYTVVIGTDAYYLADSETQNIINGWKFDSVGSTIAGVNNLEVNVASFPVTNMKGVSYDDSDILYYIINLDGDSKNYLYTYSISEVAQTQIAEYNVALMLDRNVLGTSGSPWEFEKGFHVSFPYVYQISRLKNHLFKLQDIGLTGGEVIIAITDKYLITDNADLYELQDSISDFVQSIGTLNCWDVPNGKFSHSNELSPDQLIEVYENNEDNYTLAFRGKLGRPSYENEIRVFNYTPNNLGWDDLDQKVSYVASTEGVDDVVLALIGQLTNPYIYADATSVPNIVVNMTYIFDDVKLRDALYVCCILANGYFWVEPNGYLYFSTYAAALLSKWYHGEPDNFLEETVGSITSASDMDFIDTLTLPNTCTAELLFEFDSHRNVLKITHDNAGDDPSIIHDFPGGNELTGIKEFWWGLSDNANQILIYFYSSTDIAIYIKVRLGTFQYQDSAGVWQDTGVAATNNTLFHHKIEFDVTPDTFDWTITSGAGVGLFAGVDLEFRFARTYIDNIEFRCVTNAAFSQYIDAWGDPANAKYTVGDNKRDTLSFYAKNITSPSLNILQVQYNDFSNVRGGWDSVNNKEFTPTSPLIEAHIQEYGKLLWRGRKSFVGAISQVALDAIITALKVWQGMITNPYEISFYVKGRYYYPVGYKCAFSFSEIPALNFSPNEDFIIINNTIDFQRTGAVYITISNNITRRSSK